jgi:hypothetical protein
MECIPIEDFQAKINLRAYLETEKLQAKPGMKMYVFLVLLLTSLLPELLLLLAMNLGLMSFLPDVRMIVRDLLIPVPFNDTVLLLWLHGGYNPG